MQFNCAVVDDEFLARKCIKEYIQKVPFLKLIGDYDSPLHVLGDIKDKKVDILFLDIQMPDISGLDFLKTLNPQPYTIFTTAYREYALDGYEHNVFDYLLKPFSFDRFLKAVNKVIEKLNRQAMNQIPEENQDGIKTPANDESFLIIKTNRKLCKIMYRDLIYIESQKAYVVFHTKQVKITALYTLKELKEMLPGDQFVRIHNSFIVSVRFIDSLEGNMLGIKGEKLPVGRMYRDNVSKIFRISME
jgi:DNA-binding LytR/AlgR family response regulator